MKTASIPMTTIPMTTIGETTHSWNLPIAALVIAVSVHAMAITWLTSTSDLKAGNSEQAGVGGINVGLGKLVNEQIIQQRLSPPQPKTTPAKMTPKPVKTSPVKLSNEAPSPNQKNIAINKAESVPKKTELKQQQDQPSLTKTEKSTGSSKESSNGGKQGIAQSYIKNLLAWLNQHKRYPRKAKRKKIEGVAHVAFTISRQGEVLHQRLHQTSGSNILDKAALRVLSLASPLPEVPKDFQPGKNKLSLILPVEYKIH